MAPPSFSPDTSTSSRTLSIGSTHPPPMELAPASTDAAAALLAKPLAFLQPTVQLSASFLAAAKRYLDPVAAGVSESQTLRQQDLRRKRKRGGGYDGDFRVLHLKKVHLDGFGVHQVFEQARKIVEAAAEEVELCLPGEEEDDVLKVRDGGESEEEMEEVEEYHTDSSVGEEGVDWEYDGVDEDGDEEEEAEEGAFSGEEDVDMEDDAEGVFSGDEDDQADDEPAETYVPDPNGLNDGFFSIDDFNKQTDFLEQQDQRGEGVESEDEEIDWTADPMSGKGKAQGEADDGADDDSDEGGPTFGNADLNAPDSDDDEEFEEGDLDGLDDGMNANNVMYADFYAPPAKKAGKNSKKRGRPNPHNFPAKQAETQAITDEAVEGAMARVHRDLFEDDDDDVESDGDLSDLDPSDPKSRRSTHERRQAKLAEEIRKLEAANVAKRDWQLLGEARAADRPLNSLLEENLDFERAGKPVPIITAEVSEDIEALIKRRILASEFDEVLRRRPDDLATGPIRRGRFELDDKKSGKGLAEMYEEDLLRETDPNFVEAKDEKLKKEHEEISALWKSLSAKLDSLSSSHFKPKPAAPNLEIRVDAPAIEMEDARPTAGTDMATTSMLAPQEVYKPGEAARPTTEVVTTAGMPLAREEMTKEEKLRRRRRAKEKAKKAGLNKQKADKSQKKEGGRRSEKKQLLGELKKGGVQVIGRKGALTDVEGKEVKDVARMGAGGYKL